MMADSGDCVEENVESLNDQEAQRSTQKKHGQDEHQHKDPHQDDDAEDQSPGGDPIQNDQAHLDPSRWWFASSAFPMIAGTLGPVASAFSICALVRPWRQKFPPGSDLDKASFIADPIWCVAPFHPLIKPNMSVVFSYEEGILILSPSRLTVINAIQLAVAVIANLVLLLNMAKKIKFSVAQPVTITAW